MVISAFLSTSRIACAAAKPAGPAPTIKYLQFSIVSSLLPQQLVPVLPRPLQSDRNHPDGRMGVCKDQAQNPIS
jgi:hypothetical protein